MLKRIYSKKSGFTLIEIIVAFAIFAIMATMVAQILQLSIKARQANNNYEEDLAAQEELLAKIAKDGDEYDAAEKTGTYTFTFTMTDGSQQEATLDYTIKSADSQTSAEGINYFLSAVPYDGNASAATFLTGSTGSTGTTGTTGGETTGGEYSYDATTDAWMTVGIAASKGMNYVQVNSIQEIDNAPGLSGQQTRYVISCCADGSTMQGVDKPYAEYRLYFYTNSGKPASIVGCGYVDSSGNYVDYTTNLQTVSGQKYTVKTTGANTVRIGVPFRNEGGSMNGDLTGEGIKENYTTTFYVDFEEPIENLSPSSFGNNGVAVGTGMRYYKYPLTTQNDYENVFIYAGF